MTERTKREEKRKERREVRRKTEDIGKKTRREEKEGK